MITIAVDAMNGDHAPKAEVEGAVRAAKTLGVRVVLVGQEDVVRRELEGLRRDPSSFLMLAATSMRITDAADPAVTRKPRPICTGTPEQVLADLARFAAAGYSLVICAFDCPSHTVTEICEQIDRAGQDVLPGAADVAPQGGWKPVD